MPYSRYPNADDLTQMLVGAGVDIEKIQALKPAMLPIAVAQAAAEWESATQWGLYLSTGQTETVEYDLPFGYDGWGGFGGAGAYNSRSGHSVQFLPPLLSVASVSIGGKVVTSGMAYRLGPSSAPAMGKPYMFGIFNYGCGLGLTANGNQISITCVRGRVLQLPDDVFGAVLAKALVNLAPSLGFAITGGLVRWADADISVAYSESPLSSMISMSLAQWEPTVSRHKRVAS